MRRPSAGLSPARVRLVDRLACVSQENLLLYGLINPGTREAGCARWGGPRLEQMARLMAFRAGVMNQLDNNKLTDVSPLAGLTELTVLHLHFNKITDVKPLRNLTKLKNMDMEIDY